MKKLHSKYLKNIIIIIFGIIFISGCANLRSTPRSHAYKHSHPVNFNHDSQLRKLWETHVDHGMGTFKLKPAFAANGMIFTADAKGYVTAINSNNGGIRWRVATSRTISAGIGIGSGIIVIGTINGYVLAVNQINGKLLWKKQVSDQVLGSPAVGGNYVIVKSIDGNVTALDIKTGTQIWQYNHGAPVFILRASSTPTIFGNQAIIGFADGKLAAINLANGKPIWVNSVASPNGVTDVEQLVDIIGHPQIQAGMVYTVSYRGGIVAVNLNTGDILWNHQIFSNSELVLSAVRLFSTDSNGYIWALDNSSGVVDWLQKRLRGHNLTAPAIISTPAGNGIIVGDTAGDLYWLNGNNGEFVARVHLGKHVYLAPIVVGKNIFVYTRDGTLIAYTISKVSVQAVHPRQVVMPSPHFQKQSAAQKPLLHAQSRESESKPLAFPKALTRFY